MFMNKIFTATQMLLLLGSISLKAQNAYQVNNTWVNLDTYARLDSAETPESDFKKSSKYAARFRVVNLSGELPTKGMYKDRPFRIVDDNHIGYKISPASKEINVQTNPEEEKLDLVPGNNFLFGIPDGIIGVQRFEGELGYKVTKYDEWGKVKYKQKLPHTNVVVKNGTEFKQPFLLYFMHTDRFIVFNSLMSRDIHQTMVIDMKDGKTNPISASVCGVVRADNEIAFDGYIFRDEAAKTLKVNMKKGSWVIKEANVTKVMAEAVVSDSLFVMARYYKGTAGISLAAFNAKTGKVIWVGEVKQAIAAPTMLYLSIYKNQILMEGAQTGGSYLEAFDIATGKRLYSTL